MDIRKSIMAIKNIAVVVPSHRQELTDLFLSHWQPLFDKHNVEFILVDDSGNFPRIVHESTLCVSSVTPYGEKQTAESVLFSNHCAGVRQLGFLYIAQRLPDVEYILTFDTDTAPIGDPIQDHIDQLNRSVPISWISTSTDMYMRGFPYGVREEAQVMLSHGVWETVPDYDAPTQLLTPKDFKPNYYQGPIPKGIFAPICGMNIGFRREALPYIYFAPVGNFKGAERWDDIFMGIMVIKKFSELNWAIVTGYAKVEHKRASNPFESLAKEAVGILHGEEFWKDPENYNGHPWFDEFRGKTEKWYNLTK